MQECEIFQGKRIYIFEFVPPSLFSLCITLLYGHEEKGAKFNSYPTTLIIMDVNSAGVVNKVLFYGCHSRSWGFTTVRFYTIRFLVPGSKTKRLQSNFYVNFK